MVIDIQIYLMQTVLKNYFQLFSNYMMAFLPLYFCKLFKPWMYADPAKEWEGYTAKIFFLINILVLFSSKIIYKYP